MLSMFTLEKMTPKICIEIADLMITDCDGKKQGLRVYPHDSLELQNCKTTHSPCKDIVKYNYDGHKFRRLK